MNIENYLQSLSTFTSKQDSFIFKEGDASDATMYFVIEGHISIFVENKGHRRVINEIKKDGFFGEIALIKNLPRTASAIVTSKDAQLAKLDRNIFLKISRSTPEFLFDLLKTVIDRLIIADMKIKKLTS